MEPPVQLNHILQRHGAGVFQRRVDGYVDFYRNWNSYKEGFGQLDHEFWLGNDKLYHLTNQGNYQLRIDLVNVSGSPYYAKYNMFRINDESDTYRLSELGNYSGTAWEDEGFPDEAGIALKNQVTHTFKTFDKTTSRDEDKCAQFYGGAWWYGQCASASNLNGDYYAVDKDTSIFWRQLPGNDYHSIKALR
ncbi:fibrinogen-like protein A [Apostichopus japonicus]|uniref:fibrinogen-like protein A n=1 Tax=Stichopus japonicus TaxID=307972 RepID=UPI003AB35635